MTGRLLRTSHAGSFLARQRWRTAESSRLGVPDARASRTPTSTRRPKPGRADTRGRRSSLRDVAGEPFFTACSMLRYVGGAPATGGSGGRGSAAGMPEMKSGSSAGSPGGTGAWGRESCNGRPGCPQCSCCAWRSSSSWRASGVSKKQTPSGVTSVRRRNLGGRRRSVRHVWDVKCTPANLALSTRRMATYTASWRSCHQAWPVSAVAEPVPASSSSAARRTSRSGGCQESF